MENVKQIKLFPYQERVMSEHDDLKVKIETLNRVVCGVSSIEVCINEKLRMKDQVLAMTLYLNILKSRIKAWDI